MNVNKSSSAAFFITQKNELKVRLFSNGDPYGI